MNAAFYEQYAAVEDRHWWFAARRRIVARVLGGLGLPAGARILEVGCGTGGNLAMLARFGRVEAAEMDGRACELANARGVAPVTRGWLPDGLPFEDGAYDLVALLDVLEHVEDDRAALERLARLLAPGGALVVTVPAYAFLWSRHDVVNHHFRRYRRGALVRKLREAGLAVAHATYFNTLLFPAIAAARGAGRVLGREGGSDVDAIPPAPVNRVLEAVFAAERFAAPRVRLPFGVSILAVARRPA